jgi:hypothetical protein
MPSIRYVAAAILIGLVGVGALVLFLAGPRGLPSQSVGSVPTLLAEPAGTLGAGLVLAADGLGPVTFGEAGDAVVATLTKSLGTPTEDELQPCSGGDQVRWVRWGNLTVSVQDGLFTGFISAIYIPPGSVEVRIPTEEGVGLGASVDDLVAAYGDRLDWFDQTANGYTTPLVSFGIDGFDIAHPDRTGLGGYVEGGPEEGRVITFLAGQPCVDNGP